MQKHLFGWLGAACLASVLNAAVAAAEPQVGVDVGAALPTEKFRRAADTGAAIAPWVGYRLFGVGDVLDVSLVAQPQYAGFSGDREVNIFSLTAGARFSLRNEHLEAHFSPQGGYYWGFSSDFNNDGGFNLTGGLDYKLSPSTLLGIYIRRDQSSMDVPGTDHQDVTFLVTGLSAQYRFLPPPPPVAAAPAPPPAPAPVEKKKIVLRGVHFDFDKATIRSDARPILDEAASTLKANASIAVAVEGHTDSVGTDAYNQKLSERRARAVHDYLVGQGIAASRLTVSGFGETKPVASNTTADGRAQNRRVELQVNDQ